MLDQMVLDGLFAKVTRAENVKLSAYGNLGQSTFT